MSQNLQEPQLFTLSSGTLTILFARSVSVLSLGGTTDVNNVSTQTMSIPDGVTLEVDADTGNTLNTITIAPTGGVAYIVVLSGLCTFTP